MLQKKTSLLLAISLLITFNGYCQTVSSEKEVLNLSKRKFEWMIHHTMDSLSSLLDEKVKYIHSNGWIQNKQDVISDFNSGKLVLQKVDITQADARVYNTSVIVTGKGKFEGIMNDKPFQLELMYTEVYIKKDNRWLLASRHANRLQ